jgi:hypothetical protein
VLQKLDEQTVRKLAQLGSVPDNRIARLWMCVQLTLEVATETHRRPALLAEKRIKPALSRVAKRARALRDDIANLDEGALIRLAAAMPVWRSPHRGLSHPQFADYLWVLDTLPQMAEDARTPFKDRGSNRRGRPLGTGKRNYPFLLFVSRLITDVEYEAGGRLTFNEVTGEGSLPEILKELRSFVPEGLVPATLPGTLKKILINNRRASGRALPKGRPRRSG